MQIAVMGAGSWGSALAMQLARAGNHVDLWDHRGDRAATMQTARENARYLPGLRFPDTVTITGDLRACLHDSALVVVAIPSQSIRAAMLHALPLLPNGVVLCCASKGIEQGSLMTMEEVFNDVIPDALEAHMCFLAGPSFAKEVAQDLPTAVVVAGRDPAATDITAEAFHAGNFRVYHTEDIIGAELGGALKNVVAIACGVADGVGLGLNARAALITRGLAEISRLAVALGANPLTLSGLAGMGDLVLTCTGDLSRNRRVGIGLGKGQSLAEVLAELGQVAEGVVTARSAHTLAQREGVEMPITEQIYQLLYKGKPVSEAMRDLMGRARKAERD